MQSNQTTQQGKVEFKAGDKFIVTKQSLRDQGYTEVYTVSVASNGWVRFQSHSGHEALVYHSEIEKYIPEPKKHKHYDLIIEWAKDPTNVIIQYRHSHGWSDVICNSPVWEPEIEYRIKPKTKEVTRWKWAFLTGGDQIMESTAYYTEEEAKKQFKNATPYKLEHTATTAIEEA